MIGPALRRISELAGAGELDAERERRAATITRRVLATLYRYMTVGTEPTRERVLLAGVRGDGHTLELQMVHDQLAAAGFQTIFDTDLSPTQLLELVDSRAPIWCWWAQPNPPGPARWRRRCRSSLSHPELPIVLSGPAFGGSLPRERRGMRVLERIDQTVEAVEDVLATSAPAASV